MEDCYSCRAFRITTSLIDDYDEPDLDWAGSAGPAARPNRICDVCARSLNAPFEPHADFPGRYFLPPAVKLPPGVCWDAESPHLGDGPVAHQASFEALRRSALGGCFICRVLLGVLLKDHAVYKHRPGWQPDNDGDGPNGVGGKVFTAVRRIAQKYDKEGYIHVDFTHNVPYSQDETRRLQGAPEDELPRLTPPTSNGPWFAPFELAPLEDDEVRRLREAPEDRFVRLIDDTKQWIRRCLDGHRSDPGQSNESASTESFLFADISPEQYPSRLIDISAFQPDRSTAIRLVETKEGECKGAYVALSHCWGEQKFYSCNKKTYDDLKHGVSPELLSRTFRDAIKVTGALGFRYIWIDSLCIIQGDEIDWLKEGSTMDRVYSQACITLVATASKDGSSGFFLDEEHRMASKVVEVDILKPKKRYLVTRPGLIQLSEDIEQAPLNKRAWVLQERLLSPRLMHFGREQVFLECSDSLRSEALPEDDSPPLDAGYTREKQVDLHTLNVRMESGLDISYSHLWMHLVETYSRRALAFPGDKLLAISALAKKVAGKANDFQYRAGLFESSMLRQLLWFSYTPRPRYEEYIAPSWSWASFPGRVQYNLKYFHQGKKEDSVYPLMVIEHIEVVNVQGDKFGKCISSNVMIIGNLFPLAWADLGTFEITIHFKDLNHRTHPIRFKMQPWFDSLEGDSPKTDDSICFQPVLVNHHGDNNTLHGLLLRRIQDDNSQRPQFERVGFAEEYDSLLGAFGFSWLPEFEVTTEQPKSVSDIAARFKTLIRTWRIVSPPDNENFKGGATVTYGLQ